MAVYVALLRGINVGGNNLIRMPALKACFETQGYGDVSTYIQSGNVLFTSRRSNLPVLAREIETALTKAFAYESRVVVRSADQMKAIVERAPDGFGDRPAEYRYDVLYLKEPLTAREAMKLVTTRPGVDIAVAGDGVLYFSRLISRASESQLSRTVARPEYKNMTMRNWNTTRKVFELMKSIRSRARK